VPHEEGTRQVLAMLDAVANPPRQLERFAVRSGERTIFVPVDEVEWIEAFQNYVRLHAGLATHLLHVPMNTIETVLGSDRFLRIHRSHIVNVRRIAQLWSIAHGRAYEPVLMRSIIETLRDWRDTRAWSTRGHMAAWRRAGLPEER
jgi:two-component system, LytTR family, response regulator